LAQALAAVEQEVSILVAEAHVAPT